MKPGKADKYLVKIETPQFEKYKMLYLHFQRLSQVKRFSIRESHKFQHDYYSKAIQQTLTSIYLCKTYLPFIFTMLTIATIKYRVESFSTIQILSTCLLENFKSKSCTHLSENVLTLAFQGSLLSSFKFIKLGSEYLRITLVIAGT